MHHAFLIVNFFADVAWLRRETSQFYFSRRKWKQDNDFLNLFSELRYSPLEKTPEEFPNIKQIVWNEARVMKFETEREIAW